MLKPTNFLPTDPVWCEAVDKAAEVAAQSVGCPVILIALQPDGKLAVSEAGKETIPAGHPLLQVLTTDVPGALVTIGHMCRIQDAMGKAGAVQ